MRNQIQRGNFVFDLSSLSKREKRYFTVMISGNVLYIRGVPGMAKSAIGEAICRKVVWWNVDTPDVKKMGLQYVDLRLSDKDETDLGSYPVLKSAIEQIIKFGTLMEKGFIEQETFNKVIFRFKDLIGNDDVNQLSFAVPDWAINSNTTPTIIHVEELNRCDIRVRNAALQLLNEKRIGSNFKFNETVFWMSSGNLGEKDKTEVEEMDSALSNRLIILDHDMTSDEWAQQFGREHCWDVLVDYLVNSPLEFYKEPAEGELRYSTARSWTHLSDWIFTAYGPEPDLNEVISDEDFMIVGEGCVGASITAFKTYCEDTVQVSIKDIYERWNQVKNEVMTFNRARTTSLINNLKAIPLETLETKHIENIIMFLRSLCTEWVKDWEYQINDLVTWNGFSYECKRNNCKGVSPDSNSETWKKISETDMMKSHSNDDEITHYLIHLIDTMVAKNENRHKYIVRFFRHKAELIQRWVDKGRHTDEKGKPKLK